jgi:hypothetical protein
MHCGLQIEEARARLDLPQVDYEAVMAAKLGIARQVYDIQGGRELEGADFKVAGCVVCGVWFCVCWRVWRCAGVWAGGR